MKNIRVRKKTPVTILTGFLGSGKTTLLNYILTQKHGMKIAVIENEFGEVGVDEHLVKQNLYSEEQVIETMNGCICCTVRDDLSKVIKKLLIQEKRSFDGIIIETTGMANPTPLVQTFFLEQQVQKMTYIDGIITVVDAKHIIQHLEDQSTENESIQQIAFADRIILNKIDLVSEQQVKGIKLSIRKINQSAQIIESTYSKVNPNILLGLQAFKLQNILKAKPKFLDVIQVQSKGRNRSQQYDKKKQSDHEHENQHRKENQHQNEYEHHHVLGQEKNQNHHHSHDYLHNRGISSCGCILKEPINLARFDEWIQNLISQKSVDLYRYKGVINVIGVDSPYVFQGVHQVFTGNFIKNGWEQGGIRQSSVCFIGKNLEKESLINGFKFCVASRLQFDLGDIVSCKISCGSQGWKEGNIVGLWHKGYPYLVRLINGAEITFHDHSSGRIKLISKAKPLTGNQKCNKQKILSQTDELKSKGIQLFYLQKYQQAVACFAQILAHIENNVTKVQQSHFDIKNLYSKVFKYKITCLIRMQRFQEAILNCQALIKISAQDPNVYYFNGICLIGVKRFNQALQKLEQAYQLDQDNEQLISKIRQCHRIIHEQQLIKINTKQTEKKFQKQQKPQNNHILDNPAEQIQNGSEIK